MARVKEEKEEIIREFEDKYNDGNTFPEEAYKALLKLTVADLFAFEKLLIALEKRTARLVKEAMDDCTDSLGV